MVSKQEPKKEASFWEDEGYHATHFLEALPFNLYYHLAKNNFKYDVFTDELPLLYL